MSTVVFRNKGIIDTRSITTFGVSSKECKSPIGYFGTGLKYAIAIFLKHGCDVTIYAGDQKLEFGVEKQRIRVDDFDMITMNGSPLSFTTELGKKWKTWMAFRELYCNCMDEQGSVRLEIGDDINIDKTETTILVRGEVAVEAWYDRTNIFLHGQPEYTNSELEVFPGPSSYIYYRRIRVMELQTPSLNTYNITRSLELTEDRSLKYGYEVQEAIRFWIQHDSSSEQVQACVTAQNHLYEGRLHYSGNHSTQFMETVKKLLETFHPTLNQSAIECCRMNMISAIQAQGKLELDNVELTRMERAIKFCKLLGHHVDEYPIEVSEFLGQGVLGRAHEEKIYISRRVLMMGTKMVVGTLLEEYWHLKHGLVDETREMQNFLIDAIVSIGERYAGQTL